ncbi:MAG: glycosyltransferase [Longimicrobiales bacterium]
MTATAEAPRRTGEVAMQVDAPGPRRNIICFGQQNWDYCWTGKQQLMSRLAARGHRVLYVDPTWAPAAHTSADRWRALAPVRNRHGLRHVGPGDLFVFTYSYSPLLPWRLVARRWPRVVRTLARALAFETPIAIALRPPAASLLAALRPAASIYYAVDEMTAFGDRSEQERRAVRAQEDAILGQVDLALAVSERLHRRFLEVQPRSYFLPNGADLEHFAPARLDRIDPHPAVAGLPRPRIGFVGQVDERLDQALLAAVARMRPGWQVVLAGRVKQGVDVARIEAKPNIHLIGYQDYQLLPAILREVDVCVVPYRSTELTESCNPLKVFEYLATGRPVVATPIEGLHWCRDVIGFADTAETFVQRIEEALAGTGENRAARLALAAANGWNARVDVLEQRMEQALAIRRQAEAAI